MFGHWESQTRKLNRHYQSVMRLGFWNARKGKSKLNYAAVKTKKNKRGRKMVYKISKEIVLDTEWTDGDKHIGAYNHDPVIIAGLKDTAMKGLSDIGKPLSGGANRFLGWQVTAFGLNPEIDDEDVYKYARIKGDPNEIALFPTEPGTNMIYEIQKDISVVRSVKNQSNFLSLYNSGKNIAKHDITQLNNVDFVGDNTPGQFFNGINGPYKPSMTIARGGATDLGATVTLSQAVPDDAFMDTENNKDIPIIGATVCLTSWDGGGARPRVVYILTPTVVDSTGHIVELTH